MPEHILQSTFTAGWVGCSQCHALYAEAQSLRQEVAQLVAEIERLKAELAREEES